MRRITVGRRSGEHLPPPGRRCGRSVAEAGFVTALCVSVESWAVEHVVFNGLLYCSAPGAEWVWGKFEAVQVCVESEAEA